MSGYRLQEHLYGIATPSGTYMAVSGAMAAPACRLVLKLLGQEQSPLLSEEAIVEWTGLSGPDALEVLYRLQSLALVAASEQPRQSPQGRLEVALPPRIKQLSGRRKVLLADAQGFCLVSHGFTHEVVEELAGVSAELLTLSARHERLLVNNLGMQVPHWSIVGADGGSKLGFWRLQIGAQRFSLVIEGTPLLNQPVFTDVIWCLAKRYQDDVTSAVSNSRVAARVERR